MWKNPCEFTQINLALDDMVGHFEIFPYIKPSRTVVHQEVPKVKALEKIDKLLFSIVLCNQQSHYSAMARHHLNHDPFSDSSSRVSIFTGLATTTVTFDLSFTFFSTSNRFLGIV